MRKLHLLKWLIPLFWIAMGAVCYAAVHGHEFLGLICFCLSAVSVCYILIGMLRQHRRMVAKMLRTVLSTILIIGILIFAATEAIILDASTGQSEESCDYIIVLGARVQGTAPSTSLNERINAAYDYLTENEAVIAVLSGGQGEDEDISEAQCMFDRLTAMGISADRLWLEDKSTSTWENLQFSMNIIEGKTGTRPNKAGILSSEYHLYRAGLFASDCGFEAVGIPATTQRFTIRLNYFLREVAGVWHYLILGGLYND
ncbi:MAG: YdcF family protein [Oscillospiraceae bacterium]|nr:YdcF family protein [Oscillospiraceae bacterium]MBQ9930577.1 YdcF family protein [Oscillospiraceae bacterium]